MSGTTRVPLIDARIRAWLRAEWGRSLRIDHIPDATRGHTWSVVGIMRHGGRCVKDTCSGATPETAMRRFSRSLEVSE